MWHGAQGNRLQSSGASSAPLSVPRSFTAFWPDEPGQPGFQQPSRPCAGGCRRKGRRVSRARAPAAPDRCALTSEAARKGSLRGYQGLKLLAEVGTHILLCHPCRRGLLSWKSRVGTGSSQALNYGNSLCLPAKGLCAACTSSLQSYTEQGTFTSLSRICFSSC